MQVKGNQIFLKPLSPGDVTQAYVDWMRDEEVIQFLESRWSVFTMKDLKDYVKSVNESNDDVLFGIFLKEGGEHIGNIKIGGINQKHKFADVGLIIGNKKMRGKGYGAEAIRLASDYAFKELNLNKLTAGIYADNISSYRAFIKAGYREAGRLKNHRLYKGGYVDEILVESGGD